MKTFAKALSCVLAAVLLTGCSVEQIPPAHQGKILSTDGYSPDTIAPSRVWLWGFDKLVLVETATNTFKEPMTVLLSDRLELQFDVRGRVRLAKDDRIVQSMFNDLTPKWETGNVGRVSVAAVYAKYGQMIVRNKSREVLSAYNIDDVHSSYPELSKQLFDSLTAAFKGTPLHVSDVAIGKIAFPKVVTDAVGQQKEREIAIGRERAQVEIELTKKRGEEQLAEADYRIRLLKAKTIRDENLMVSEGVSDRYLAYRQLEVQEAMAQNGAAVFMPYEAMQSIGAQMRMFLPSTPTPAPAPSP